MTTKQILNIAKKLNDDYNLDVVISDGAQNWDYDNLNTECINNPDFFNFNNPEFAIKKDDDNEEIACWVDETDKQKFVKIIKNYFPEA